MEATNDGETLKIGNDIEKIGNDLKKSRVVVNLKSKIPTFSYVKGHHLNDMESKLPSELVGCHKANRDGLDYVNIPGDHWEEICGYPKRELQESSDTSCDLDTVSRNVMDYLTLQKSLFNRKMKQKEHPVSERELCEIKETEKERKSSTCTKRDSSSSSLLNAPYNEKYLQEGVDEITNDVLSYKQQLRSMGVLDKIQDSLNICFHIQNHVEKLKRALKNPLFLFKVLILCLGYILIGTLTFVLLTPMLYREEEFRNDFGQKIPAVLIDIMSWISSSVSFFPIMPTVPPPSTEISTFWLFYKTLQFISFT